MFNIFRKIAPNFLLSWYHFILAYLGALVYGFPSREMIVIGVTGTKGKTTTCNLIAQILNFCGYKTGMASTVNFRISEKEWINETKQTMLGRFQLQKLLRQMADARCEYAVIETSSEGILQHRHRGIDYKIAVFTNLSPEHIERHGSFEKYRAEKLKLFEIVARRKDGIGVYNLDDENVGYFLKAPVKNRYGFYINSKIKNQNSKLQIKIQNFVKILEINNIQLSANGSKFNVDGFEFEMPLIGEFNVYNAAAAICVALSQNIPMAKIQEALKIAKPTPGRMEIIDEGQGFTAIVDYSYEPKGLESALQAIKVFNPKRIIVLTGSAGGGRDKWRRPVMGEIADKYADVVVITTDDPYDEKPEDIVREVLAGAMKNPARKLGENIFEIIDRREAIKKAIDLAQEGDAILFAGKGGERWMNLAKGKKISWDEAEIVREEIKGKHN
jgi:UDP-N-acetylmuramoyl-L-alanyl-D-glutamate--2,6-diaminopimelate ligase